MLVLVLEQFPPNLFDRQSGIVIILVRGSYKLFFTLRCFLCHSHAFACFPFPLSFDSFKTYLKEFHSEVFLMSFTCICISNKYLT